jgi:hypothetical protein
MSNLTQNETKPATGSDQAKIPAKPVVLKGDFAAGERTEPPVPEGPDFARGERTEPPVPEGPDFARGERTEPPAPEGPDFARGERTESADNAANTNKK